MTPAAAVVASAEAKQMPASSAAAALDAIYINQPAEYTGDTWHLAAAMVLNPKVHVVLTATSEKDKANAAKTLEYYVGLGFDTRVKPCPVRLARFKVDAKAVNGKPLAEKHRLAARAALRKDSSTKDAEVYSVYHSTAIIMGAVKAMTASTVTNLLRDRLCRGASEAAIRSKVATFLDPLWKRACIAAGPHVPPRILFINGRLEGYNPQHSLNAARLKLILEAAKRVPGTFVYVLTNNMARKEAEEAWEKLPANKRPAEDEHAWLKAVPEGQINDIFDIVGPKTKKCDIPAFWKELASSPHAKHFYFVGGRSGSTDIAAFMGIQTLCWDHFDLLDAEYIRLRMTAPALMQVCHIPEDKKAKYAPAVAFRPRVDQTLGSSVEEFLRGRFMTASFCLAGQPTEADEKAALATVQKVLDSITKGSARRKFGKIGTAADSKDEEDPP